MSKIVVCVVLAMIVPGIVIAQTQSENFTLSRQVLGSGGAAGSSESYAMYCTYGQSSPLGRQTSETLILRGGFMTSGVNGIVEQIPTLSSELLIVLIFCLILLSIRIIRRRKYMNIK